MDSNTLHVMVGELAAKLDDPLMQDASVIRWGSPIPAFGDISSARLATVGLNPSNNEFVDNNGTELTGKERRFHTLRSLCLDRWSNLRKAHIAKIVESYAQYFTRNPYDTWFAQLEFIISGAGSTFYGSRSNACHLDLVPYATECKWTSLSKRQKTLLFDRSSSVLADCINSSDLELLVLNGQSVVDAFQSLFDIDFTRTEVLKWKLPRKNSNDVKGYAYFATIEQIDDVALSRAISVLGFNHNLQSSFGVTREVRRSIREWIAMKSREISG